MIRAVFDCNVFWQIFFSETGIGAKCWELVTNEQVELIVSNEILDEIRDVLTRPETQARFAKATVENVAIFIDEIIEFAIFVPFAQKKSVIQETRKMSRISIWQLRKKPNTSSAEIKICLI
jgi:putative PIN family toxin of toxin-antitoxin system